MDGFFVLGLVDGGVISTASEAVFVVVLEKGGGLSAGGGCVEVAAAVGDESLGVTSEGDFGRAGGGVEGGFEGVR